MADGVTLNSGSGGATIATDDDGTAHHQYVKLVPGVGMKGGGTPAATATHRRRIQAITRRKRRRQSRGKT